MAIVKHAISCREAIKEPGKFNKLELEALAQDSPLAVELGLRPKVGRKNSIGHLVTVWWYKVDLCDRCDGDGVICCHACHAERTCFECDGTGFADDDTLIETLADGVTVVWCRDDMRDAILHLGLIMLDGQDD